MKRFYKEAAAVMEDGLWSVQLDGRPVRTPSRALLAMPTQSMGEAVAAEWAGQGEEIDPRSMMFTGFANAAIDQIAPDMAGFAAGVAAYGESDLLCYRADGPAELVARQAAAWEPLLEWAAKRYDIAFHVTAGIIHVTQPPQTVARLSAVVGALDAFSLAGFSTLVTLSGSLVCGLAVVEGGADAATVWNATEIDEIWQMEQWGDDAEAAARRATRAAEFAVAAAFCSLARG